ncbi:type 1 glutamine amidotransferase [Flaviflexus salsibiostraticola]|uniref:Type 1 glutamine amidotransferase n=1 Tax=Flaviflexus salsibiostraticola TaxID=1282737 RepID=A0A3Q8WUA2_9ACTO|nr:type 1 glutamine amidotransferase domain-containing protein [Flaviflexus salsibiostraticola]AZN30423.1 type 1 glutamine amidotransferase [Flaviflexus salsibiostraticola]
MDLTGHRIAFLTKRGVEQPELTEPWKAIEAAGGEPVLVSDEPGTIVAMIGDWDHGDEFTVDVTLDEANPDDYLALVLPGGTINADKIRTNEKAQAFVKAFMDANKPVAPICHGPWILIDAGVIEGRTLTSTTRIKHDLVNAGANWVDEEFCVDGNLLSSRSPRDLDAFNAGIVKAFSEAAARQN